MITNTTHEVKEEGKEENKEEREGRSKEGKGKEDHQQQKVDEDMITVGVLVPRETL